MKLFGSFLFLCILKLSNAELPQSVPKCADFQPVDHGNLEKILMGRWNVYRWFGNLMTGEDNVCSCLCFIGAHSDEEHKIWTQNVLTKSNGEVLNMTTLASVIKNGVMEVSITREVDFGSMKMNIYVKAVHTLLLLEGDIGMIATCYDNPIKQGEFFQTAGVLVRNTTVPSKAFMDKVDKILDGYGMNKTFTEIVHEKCQY